MVFLFDSLKRFSLGNVRLWLKKGTNKASDLGKEMGQSPIDFYPGDRQAILLLPMQECGTGCKVVLYGTLLVASSQGFAVTIAPMEPEDCHSTRVLFGSL